MSLPCASKHSDTNQGFIKELNTFLQLGKHNLESAEETPIGLLNSLDAVLMQIWQGGGQGHWFPHYRSQRDCDTLASAAKAVFFFPCLAEVSEHMQC